MVIENEWTAGSTLRSTRHAEAAQHVAPCAKQGIICKGVWATGGFLWPPRPHALSIIEDRRHGSICLEL
jgi:hypothetical protein